MPMFCRSNASTRALCRISLSLLSYFRRPREFLVFEGTDKGISEENLVSWVSSNGLFVYKTGAKHTRAASMAIALGVQV